jgi:hypothetical protein
LSKSLACGAITNDGLQRRENDEQWNSGFQKMGGDVYARIWSQARMLVPKEHRICGARQFVRGETSRAVQYSNS